LSAKYAEGKLIILSHENLKKPQASLLDKGLAKFGEGSFFVIDGDVKNENLAKASSNLSNVVMVPQIGANVYDIIKHDYLILTAAGVEALEKRLNHA
jgi:large subunit ribosomal protein L4